MILLFIELNPASIAFSGGVPGAEWVEDERRKKDLKKRVIAQKTTKRTRNVSMKKTLRGTRRPLLMKHSDDVTPINNVRSWEMINERACQTEVIGCSRCSPCGRFIGLKSP